MQDAFPGIERLRENAKMNSPEQKARIKAAAIQELREGLKSGAIKVEIITTCSNCKLRFKNDQAFEDHIIDSKVIDKKTGKPFRICSNWDLASRNKKEGKK